MKVILISGKAQSGKDTTAKILQEQLNNMGNKTLITHYADLLKFICRNYFGWDGKKDDKGRELLQYVGTDVIRRRKPDFWVYFVSVMLWYFSDRWDYVIIPDCRFPNEIDEMRDWGFETIHIRVVRENFKSPLSKKRQAHPSETALDSVKPDYYIYNNGTLEDLEGTIKEWIKENL